MKKLSFIFIFLFIGLILPACSNNKSNQQRNTDTSITDTTAVKNDEKVNEFITEVLNSGALEVELGELAQTSASNSRVKAFGAMMVRDHTAVSNELKVIAVKKNIDTAQVLKGNYLKAFEDLKKDTGVIFDKQYMEKMLSDQRKAIRKFEDMAKNDGDTAVSSFAAKTLPKLKAHLDSVEAINKEVKGSTDKDN